jgi:hypothetical protein
MNWHKVHHPETVMCDYCGIEFDLDSPGAKAMDDNYYDLLDNDNVSGVRLCNPCHSKYKTDKAYFLAHLKDQIWESKEVVMMTIGLRDLTARVQVRKSIEDIRAMHSN